MILEPYNYSFLRSDIATQRHLMTVDEFPFNIISVMGIAGTEITHCIWLLA